MCRYCTTLDLSKKKTAHLEEKIEKKNSKRIYTKVCAGYREIARDSTVCGKLARLGHFYLRPDLKKKKKKAKAESDYLSLKRVFLSFALPTGTLSFGGGRQPTQEIQDRESGEHK